MSELILIALFYLFLALGIGWYYSAWTPDITELEE